MRIAIFETEHFEGAYPVIRLFDIDSNHLTIFTNETCYRQFQFLLADRFDRFDWVVRANNESKYQFIYRMYRELRARKTGLLYLNTVSDNFIFYALLVRRLENTRVVLTLHDINTFFRHRLAFSLRRVVRIAGKRMLVRAVNEFNVVAMTMTDYLRRQLPEHKKVHCVPGAVFEVGKINLTPGPPGRLIIAVPGTLDGRRRNYDVVFELLDACRQGNVRVQFILLGGAYGDDGERILARAKQYGAGRDDLAYYDAPLVDQPEFDRVLNAAHLVFVPSVIDTVISDDIAETYGVSKSSGNMFDIIKHAKPFVAPVQLKIDPFLEQSCIRYRKVNDIVAALVHLQLEPAAYAALLERAAEASRHYTVDAVRQRNSDLFLAI